jgi:signal transduction histidine kinase
MQYAQRYERLPALFNASRDQIVTAFNKLIRTTAFRLTLAYLLLFALFAASLLGYFAWNTRRLINEQIMTSVNAEVGEINNIYARRGLLGLTRTIGSRALRPGANLYLVTAPNGQAVGGNIESLAPGVMATTGWSETSYRRIEDQDTADHRALVNVSELSNGFRLLIGRDLEERRRVFGIVAKAAQWSVLIVIALGLGGGIFVARRVLRRIDAMTGTTQRIMAGDLSGRLPVGRSGDELDRLAENLNAMLERIEALMVGLKEVSDNIAHDLKTPLTRLRNRAEEALAKAGNEAEYRAALERTLEESDGLIRTFNALLMIARAESGQARGNMDDFDAADVAQGIQELYEPLAEDNGLTLHVKTEPARLHGNRELISQALANLVENAIKYGQPAPALQPLSAEATHAEAGASEVKDILIEARRDGDQVLLSVTDRGQGIPEAERDHAVERFVRLEASRTQPGSGLGLSLASAVATLHGGALKLSDAHPGLRATLAIPALAGGSDRVAVQTPDVPQKMA